MDASTRRGNIRDRIGSALKLGFQIGGDLFWPLTPQLLANVPNETGEAERAGAAGRRSGLLSWRLHKERPRLRVGASSNRLPEGNIRPAERVGQS